jgi:hypothetical protein
VLHLYYLTESIPLGGAPYLNYISSEVPKGAPYLNYIYSEVPKGESHTLSFFIRASPLVLYLYYLTESIPFRGSPP